MNSLKNVLLVSLLSMTLASCGGGTNPSGSTPVDESAYEINDKYYSNVEKRVPFDKENPLNFDEEFTDKMDDNVWYAIEGSWHTDVSGAPHNGMKKRNLFYTKDSTGNGYLAIRGRGIYNKDNDFETNKPEGGGIETINHLLPGRYIIRMAAMPREGGVSTMWTYCSTTGSEATSQNEIDIEIGGTTKASQYEHEWCTSWTKHTDKETRTVNVTDILYLNDGKMHDFAFDWYTDYKNSNEGRVDWFIDGKYIESLSGSMIPDHAMPLWVGLWFPPLWAGVPAFTEDYMIIDRITYTAFSDSQYADKCRSYITYNPVKPSTLNIQNVNFDSITKNLNKFSNGEFESTAKCTDSRDSGSYFGWLADNPEVYKGTLSLSNEHTEGSHSYMLSASTDSSVPETERGIYLGQNISNSFPGYKFNLSIDAKKTSDDSEGNIEISYRTTSGKSLKTERIAINSTTFSTYTKEITMPENASALKIYITAEKGSILYDNAKLFRVI